MTGGCSPKSGPGCLGSGSSTVWVLGPFFLTDRGYSVSQSVSQSVQSSRFYVWASDCVGTLQATIVLQLFFSCRHKFLLGGPC